MDISDHSSTSQRGTWELQMIKGKSLRCFIPFPALVHTWHTPKRSSHTPNEGCHHTRCISKQAARLQSTSTSQHHTSTASQTHKRSTNTDRPGCSVLSCHLPCHPQHLCTTDWPAVGVCSLICFTSQDKGEKDFNPDMQVLAKGTTFLTADCSSNRKHSYNENYYFN